MNKRLLAAAIAAVVGCSGIGVVSAQERKPEDQIKMRRAALTLMNWNFGPIGGVVKGQRAYNRDEVVQLAERVAFLSHLPWEAFGAGTDSGDTRALPAIWSNPDKFKAAQDRLKAEAAKLVDAAKSGDQGQLKSQFGATAKACSACHDDFRRK